jgi:hypothetical protein
VIAGAVRNILLRAPSGKLVRFFCLVDTSGKSTVSPLVAEGAGPWLKLAVSAR